MPSYLDHYGADEGRRAARRRTLIRTIAAALIVALIGVALYFQFRNYRQEALVSQFIDLLRAKEYQKAYELWGCTQQNPCPGYKPEKFLEDFGPSSSYADAANARIDLVETCGNGVLISVRFPKGDPLSLWVEGASQTIGFAPWPECPGRKWRFRQFFDRLFGRA